ncbi:MAG: bifunctional methylenetetrahydrofolate dehydrogenase/methenyltetrahydrofolate cyclohydrolase [Clostridia bacterium]|nr:bifunctional methylenetetrahydrofolate dehydrogenase/methenyltetrahydrofolate cyclohydrolase [Clostridia bacterium]MBQ2111410.1 bifunctional methylenetetrahydrofolate dehydrogenase/methenyltetrahydrofolate cyclohydrolase [Clostridia bacterium]MBQ2190883.1 bifunctional methylenetetrahydrofolate dehydrogenase/methenyltetrahydrofolate cyclohydrolase [Clostridia bacterium]MBQ3938020.1 bifunctional methylenetetrahydrofolate dehydrogenase/methenyltetrahydrofolate cyclohydrolase [Clostridia bacteriu
MSATVIDGKAIAGEVYEELSGRIEKLNKSGVIPRVAIIEIGEDEMSKRYVSLKENAAIRLGMECVTYHLVAGTPEKRVLELIDQLNADPSVHGMLVQMPLPEHIDAKAVLDAIDPTKDIDGIHFCNAGKLLNGEPAIVACTPRAIIRILDSIGVDVESRHTVVVGKSILVGRPIAMCFLNRSATVSVCHTKTQNLGELTRNADILIVAAGSAKLIKADMVKEGAVVIDVGQTNIDGKLVGDVDFDEVAPKASFITKVTGGVGPMTVAMLMANLVDCAENRSRC